MTCHKDAVNSWRKSVKIDVQSGKEQQRMFVTRFEKIIFNASNA